jgi:CRISPR-associated protein Cas2
MLLLVTYDIADDRRRQAVFECLQAVGTRVQLSTFECRIDDLSAERTLIDELTTRIDEAEDQIRMYRIDLGEEGENARIIGARVLEEWRSFHIL